VKRALLGVVAAVVLAVALVPAAAQTRPVRFEGSVQWIAGQSMLVLLDSGLSVNVNLIRVPQWQYLALLPGERILVTGTITGGTRNVAGVAIERLAGTEAP
jgi:hypothetical protein